MQFWGIKFIAKCTTQRSFLKDASTKSSSTLLILNVLDERDSLTIVDDATGFDDELFWIQLELMESRMINAFQHFYNGAAS